MGARGPARDPNSRRGRREKPSPVDAPEQPIPPSWLSRREKRAFDVLVRDLTVARVPIKGVDALSISNAAATLVSLQTWIRRGRRARSITQKLEIEALIGRLRKELAAALNVIGGTPSARLRMGLRGGEPKPGRVLSIIRAKEARENHG